jgi:cardiolipin synthase (CMP-forming)
VRHLPNLICLLRIALVWPVANALVEENYPLALVLFVIAAVSDGLDGYLAKRFGWTSQLGKVIDPLADKLLLVTVFITASWHGLVPWWVAAAAIARDVMIGLGALIFRLWFGPLKGRPTIISKINTLFQLGYIAAVMLVAAVGILPQDIVDALAYIMFVTTVLSGADYLYQFTKRAWDLPPGPIRPVAAPAGDAVRR